MQNQHCDHRIRVCVESRRTQSVSGRRRAIASHADRELREHRFVELDDLDQLSAAWDRLARRSGSPIEQYIWAKACAETFGDRYSLRALVVGPSERPVAIAPLSRRRRPLAPLELVGVHALREPMDFLYANRDAAMALARVLAELRMPLSLKRCPADSSGLAAVANGYRSRGLVFSRGAGGCPYLPLDERHATPEVGLSARRRSDLRRARRRATRLGRVTCEVLSPAPTEVGPLLEEAFRVEAAGWKGRAGTALLHDPMRQAFFRRYAAAAASKGILLLCFLRIGGRAAAMQIAVQTGGRFWLLKVGYDEEFASCSPGSVLLEETIRDAAAGGLRSYEFLGHAEAWTRPWTSRVRPCVHLEAYPLEARGVGGLATHAAALGGRRLRGVVRSRT
jgi:CelD/BcsL family acetyltransferase involved in cellulose biosynthesis